MDDELQYTGRRVLVTGAASGIGRAAAELMVGLGAEVHATDVTDVTAVGLTGMVGAYVADLSDRASIDTLVASVPDNIEAVFHCAGLPGTFDPDRVLAVNFCGTRHLVEQLVPTLSPGSALCLIGSTSAVGWLQRLPLVHELLDTDGFDAALAWCRAHVDELGYAYDFSKEAVLAYVAVRALTLTPTGVRLNCVSPGGTKTAATPEFSKAVKAKEHGPEMLQNYPRLMGRLARPVEQAWPMAFLNSPRASFVTGTNLYVDAGFTGGLVTEQFHPVVADAMRWSPWHGGVTTVASNREVGT